MRQEQNSSICISIHALREEGDGTDADTITFDIISIHALREEGDSFSCQPCCRTVLFLSTPSARRATWNQLLDQQDRKISIHALREEGDLESAAGSAGQEDFYPRPPRGGRPGLTAWPAVTAMLISIHALREEGDKLTETRLRLNTDFYPRPPRGGRPRVVLIINQFVIISIHALREEGDQMAQAMGAELVVFLSTPSARRATALDM